VALLAGSHCGGSSNTNLIQATQCSGTFTSCGGDPTGSWEIIAICVEGDLVAALDAELSSQQTACSSTFTAADLSATGSVTYGAGSVGYKRHSEVVESIEYTPACTAALTSGATLDATVCSQMQSNLNKESGTQATCTFAGGNCKCSATVSQLSPTGASYTVSGSTITESDGSAYDLCVTGTTMVQRELISGNVYAVTQLRKR